MTVSIQSLINLSFNAKTAFRLVVFALISASLTACGFHLRGNIPLSASVKNMYLNAPDGTFKDQLEERLTQAGVVLSDTKVDADVVLLVTKALSDRSVGTLDDRGKVDSYNLRLNVIYRLDNAAGDVLRASTNLSETRQYNFNPEQVVQSESEEADLLVGMEEAIALRILRQLSSITDADIQSRAAATPQ